MQEKPLKILFVKEPKSDNSIIRTLCSSLGNFEIEFTSTLTVYMQVMQSNPDIHAVLLDADLQEDISALEACHLLRLNGAPVPTALMTSKPLEACTTANLNICDTIPKPFTFERLKACLIKLKQAMAYQQFLSYGGLYVPVISDRIMHFMPDEILFIESVNRTAYVHTLSDCYETKISIKLYEQYLVYNDFFLTHRSCLVNLNKINRVSDQAICFKNSDKAAIIAEEKRHAFMHRFQIHNNKQA
ncbi:LytR/AlgR family response regulator transcription factor [Cohnella terricola]|uniref:DNA-binding response regulator n=1 Tax=Cohnella terricola TaxID=1289167 RepID=A0A559JDJ4_9BACL|nr:LytTR family DNA-binding domain-containing protein [Cohnella terricola]TVX97954.1 DNA-binding response regulator [Cohnella terricola]